MEEIESPTEQVQDDVHHHALLSREKWITGVALTSALLAALAAVAALISGHHSNEAMVDQIKASDAWNYYQAKGIKAAILHSRFELEKTLGKTPDAESASKSEQYKKDQEEIEKEAREKTSSAEAHLAKHLVLARSVTLFQVAIAVSAISALTHRRRFWHVGIVFGLVGIIFLLIGIT